MFRLIAGVLARFASSILVSAIGLSGCDRSPSADASTRSEGSGVRVEHAAEHVVLPGVLVSPAWLAAQGGDGIVIVDTREAHEYAEGHIPGAVSIPYRETFDTLPENSDNVAPIPVIAKLFSRAGIDRSTAVVVYGPDGDYRPAARVFWVLELHGHPAVAVLNGGFGRWLLDSHESTTDIPAVPPRHFVPDFDNRRLADKLEVSRAMRDLGTVLLDARSPGDYAGIPDDQRFPSTGHIPTAVNLPAKQLYIYSGSICALAEIDRMTEVLEEFRGKSVIAYCGTGRSASVAYLALRATGIDAAVYDGGWSEWSNDGRLPVVQGGAPGDSP